MKKVLKWIGIVLGSLLLVLVLAVAGLAFYAQSSFKRLHPERGLYPISADTSPEGVKRGEYLITRVMSCDKACHSDGGTKFAGMAEEIAAGPIQVTFAVPNITQDKETGIGDWTDNEIARAIREGIGKDGRELVVMPSYSYTVISDEDLAAIIGYLRTIEPVRNEIPEFQANTFAKIAVAINLFGPKPVQPAITEPRLSPPAGTTEYGSYLVNLGGCRDCHQSNLAGGNLPFAEPGIPRAANLTPAGNLRTWTEADFLRAMHTGVTPDGRNLDPENMPWPAYGQMTDEDLAAIFSYLQSLPAEENTD